ncbi:MAG: glyoxylate/hydroxypyruvate reductase A [Rhodobacteraceae bacterium]|nr:MAG: glyoxylate/hydroxypyruvate reductase A [Paracoccaceae bacterium]
MKILYFAKEDEWEIYQEFLNGKLTSHGFTDFQIFRETDTKIEDFDFVIYAPKNKNEDFSRYKNLKAIFSLWAGIETIISNETIDVPLIKMVDEGLTKGMIEWCTAHTLRYHLNLDHYIKTQDGAWSFNKNQLLAFERNISVLGLGNIGMEVAKSLRDFGFSVSGWSAQKKFEPGIRCYSGEDTLRETLEGADIVICLLPETKKTIGLLNKETFSYFKDGAKIINAGRGSLIDDDALLNSIENGKISHATLDVFNEEPLPKKHLFWSNKNVTVTPHIAAISRPDTCVNSIAMNIARYKEGKDFIGLVDNDKGY